MVRRGRSSTKNEATAIEQYIGAMRAVTQSLIRMDEHGAPAFLTNAVAKHLLGSGFLVSCAGRLLLVSAKHVLEKGNWALETQVVHKPTREVLLYRLDQPDNLPHDDLSFVDVDEERLRREFGRDERNAGKELKLATYNGPLTEKPLLTEVYGFAAANNVLLATSSLANPDLIREGSYEVGMTYDGTESDGRYRFKLARAHQGREYYSGASGAPISAPDGVIVSIVSGGKKEANVIYGSPLTGLVAKLSKS